MDYEKALEKARAAYGTGAYDDATLEFIFPQIKESEDERVIKGLENFLWCIANGGMNDRGTMPSAEMCQKWLAYLEKQKEQKPAEWSEGEITHLYALASFIKSSGYEDDGEFLEGVANKLKTFHDRPTAEWSEEDERTRKSLISLIEEIKSQPLKRLEDWDGYIHFLKSLRPSWRPSEEQMKSLAQARDYYMGGKIKLVGNHLVEIYEHLKELIGQ